MRVIAFCPEWELLASKCFEIVSRLRSLRVEVDVRDVPSLGDLKFLKIENGLVRLPQIVVARNDHPVLVLGRDDIEHLSVEELVRRIINLISEVR